MILEHVDRRVPGAIRFVSVATGLQVREPLLVEAEGVRLARNRSGYYVIFDAPGLEEHTHAFEQPPETPALGSVAIELTVRDPGGRFLPRRAAVSLPLDPDPQNIEAVNSLFRPQEVSMFPSPSLPVASGWSVVRATVLDSGTQRRLPGALLLVTRTVNGDTSVLGRGLSDGQGEALVAVVGIPVTTWAEDDSESVVATEVEATIQAFFDPEAEEIVDPDDLEARAGDLPSASADISLASGREIAVTLSVTLP